MEEFETIKKKQPHIVEMKKESINKGPTFTAREYKHIIAMFYNKNGNG